MRPTLAGALGALFAGMISHPDGRAPARAVASRRLRDALLAVVLLSAACGGDTGNTASDGGAGSGAIDYAALCPADPKAYQPLQGRELCIAMPAVGGVATCPAADDPALPALLSYNAISGPGGAVSVTTVVGDISQHPLPASCVTKAHCCETLADQSLRTICSFEAAHGRTGSTCDLTQSAGRAISCSAPDEGAANDRAACCYHACGSSYSYGRPLTVGADVLLAALATRADWQST